MKKYIIHTRHAKSIVAKSIGLIGQTQFKPLFIKTRSGIHTFGMKQPIDILVLTNEQKVAKLKKNLSQNRLFFWNPVWDKVLELPVGFIDKEKIKIGDMVELIIEQEL